MDKKTRKFYSEEFKGEAVELSKRVGVPRAARELGVAPSIHRELASRGVRGHVKEGGLASRLWRPGRSPGLPGTRPRGAAPPPGKAAVPPVPQNSLGLKPFLLTILLTSLAPPGVLMRKSPSSTAIPAASGRPSNLSGSSFSFFWTLM